MVGSDEHKEPDHAEDDEHNNQQEASNEQVGESLLFRAGMGDAKGGDEGFGEPGEEFQANSA